jgi:hypothetical protein
MYDTACIFMITLPSLIDVLPLNRLRLSLYEGSYNTVVWRFVRLRLQEFSTAMPGVSHCSRNGVMFRLALSRWLEEVRCLKRKLNHVCRPDNTGQQDFVPRKVYWVSNVTFHAESKYAIKVFPSPTVFVHCRFLL